MPDTWGHGARHVGSRCQIHGVTVPDTWGHGAGHTGSRCRTHGVTVPDSWGHGVGHVQTVHRVSRTVWVWFRDGDMDVMLLSATVCTGSALECYEVLKLAMTGVNEWNSSVI